MKGDFRTLLRKFCLESTILGLKYFYLYPDLISRLFWLCNIGSVLCLAFVLSWLLYSRFAEMPTRIAIENQYEPVENLPYPAIFLCSPNQITESFMHHFNRTLVDGNLTIDLERVLPMLLGFYELVNDVDINDVLQLQSLLDLNRYTVSEVMGAIPQSCSSFLKMCIFEGETFTDCTQLFTPILTTHGLCCAFNSVYEFKDKRNIRHRSFEEKYVKQPNNGLAVVCDYHPEDAIRGTILNAGATRVMYTDYSEFPTDDESNMIEKNAETYHIIHATYTYCTADVRALPVSSRRCYFEDEKQVPFFVNFHNSDCDLACYVTAVEDNCHCQMFFVPHARPDKICNLTSIPCIMDVKSRMNEWLTVSQCDCLRDCESRRYKVDMIVGNLDALPYMVYNPYSDIKFNKSTSLMYFYFPTSVYVKQKQETVMSLISLVSNLGGVFGLCLGCSGISVLEILFYLYVAIRNSMHRRFGHNRVHQSENALSTFK